MNCNENLCNILKLRIAVDGETEGITVMQVKLVVNNWWNQGCISVCCGKVLLLCVSKTSVGKTDILDCQ